MVINKMSSVEYNLFILRIYRKKFKSYRNIKYTLRYSKYILGGFANSYNE